MKKYYTIKFFVKLDVVGYNNGLNAFMLDCTSTLGWDLNVRLQRADLNLFEISVELDSDKVYYNSTAMEALAYILNRGKRAFSDSAYSMSFYFIVRKGGRLCYRELEYDRDGKRIDYDSWCD